MKKILAILMLLMLNLNIALAQNLEIDETNLSEKDIQYLSAWTSLAVYNDKFSLLARDILKSNGFIGLAVSVCLSLIRQSRKLCRGSA